MAFEDGTIIDVSGKLADDNNPLAKEWYVKAKENNEQIYVCDPYVDAGTQNIVLTLSKEIALNDGRKAILGVDMQISNINEFLNAIGQDTVDAETSATLSETVDTETSATPLNAEYESTINKADKSYVFLIDRRGNIISHPNPDFSPEA